MSALEYASTNEDKYQCNFKIGKCYLNTVFFSITTNENRMNINNQLNIIN